MGPGWTQERCSRRECPGENGGKIWMACEGPWSKSVVSILILPHYKCSVSPCCVLLAAHVLCAAEKWMVSKAHQFFMSSLMSAGDLKTCLQPFHRKWEVLQFWSFLLCSCCQRFFARDLPWQPAHETNWTPCGLQPLNKEQTHKFCTVSSQIKCDVNAFFRFWMNSHLSCSWRGTCKTKQQNRISNCRLPLIWEKTGHGARRHGCHFVILCSYLHVSSNFGMKTQIQQIQLERKSFQEHWYLVISYIFLPISYLAAEQNNWPSSYRRWWIQRFTSRAVRGGQTAAPLD